MCHPSRDRPSSPGARNLSSTKPASESVPISGTEPVSSMTRLDISEEASAPVDTAVESSHPTRLAAVQSTQVKLTICFKTDLSHYRYLIRGSNQGETTTWMDRHSGAGALSEAESHVSCSTKCIDEYEVFDVGVYIESDARLEPQPPVSSAQAISAPSSRQSPTSHIEHCIYIATRRRCTDLARKGRAIGVYNFGPSTSATPPRL